MSGDRLATIHAELRHVRNRVTRLGEELLDMVDTLNHLERELTALGDKPVVVDVDLSTKQ